MKNDMMFNQVTRLKKYVDSHILTVQVGRQRHLMGKDITSVNCPFIPKWERMKGYTYCRAALKAFKRLHREHDFDLVHAYFTYPHGLAAYEIHKKFGVPYIITGRGDDVLLYPKRNKYLHESVSKSLRNCAGYIGVSQHIVDAAVDLGARKNRCLFRPNGIPTEIFSWSKEIEKIRNRQQVLFVGALLPVKNVIKLVEAFTVVLKEMPHVQLLMAGEGSLEFELQQNILGQRLGNSIKLIGKKTHNELASLMQSSHVLTLPSVSEGWPNVVMEAMACGTPVVASDRCGMPEQIINDSYGYLCKPNSVEDIAEKLIFALKRNDWHHKKIHERGIMYNRNATASVIAEFYHKILSMEEGVVE